MQAYNHVSRIEKLVNWNPRSGNSSCILLLSLLLTYLLFFFHGTTDPSGPGSPHYVGFTNTFRNTTLGKSP